MVVPLRQRGGMTTNKWLAWTICLLYGASVSAANNGATILSGSDPPRPLTSVRNTQPGRSPAEIPLLKHDAPTPKFRNTDTNEEVERYQALAPASQKPAVRAPPAQSTESIALSPLQYARQLADWEADDIILLSTIDGTLHARDRKTGRERWSLQMPADPMIQTTHYQQNRSALEELQMQDDYIFIVEPSSDGQLYAQFADPRIDLVRLPATVKKMATEVPFSMQLNGQYLATTSEQQSKAYTIDAQTGEILHEFPKSKSSIKNHLQPRCRPRTGFDIEDSACTPGRTIRLGRNTYVFTISDEQTGQDLCTIRFSEWVTNRMDQDLQNQHTSSLDGYDVRVFHNGWVMGLDTTAEQGRQHKYRYMLTSPVARVFDVARKLDTDDDSTDLALLGRSADFVLPADAQLLRQDLHFNSRVFVNRTEQGQWYAMSEASYPGVTTTAMLARVEQDYSKNELLDLHGDMSDIIGVHLLSGKLPFMPQQLTIGESAPNLDVIAKPEEELISLETDETPITYWSRLSDGFWGGILTLLICALAYSWRHYSRQDRKALLAQLGSSNIVEIHNPAVPQVQIEERSSISAPILSSNVTLPDIPKPDDTVATVVATPMHSRAQSLVSAASPRKDDNASDDSEDEDESPTEKKKKKTKRGVRGGRRKKNKAGETFEPKPLLSNEKHLKDGLVQVGRLAYDSKLENCLGQGSSGTAVFPGTFDGRAVAVKRLVKTANSLAEKEIRHLVSSDEHPNVIRYHGKEESPSFFYIALDKFDTSLDQFVEHYEKYPTLVSPTRGYDVKDALRQITRGVQHLHSLKLVHRDIKPQNILVRPVKSNRSAPEGQLTPLLFVISDFGLCKPLEDGPESVFAATRTAAGTTGWKAPELLVSSRDAIAAPMASLESTHSTTSQSLSRSVTASSTSESGVTAIDAPSGRRATKAIDIFSLGCVFFYVMTRGGHPFDKGGSPLARDLNIKEDKYDTSLLRDSFVGYDYDADDLIMQMVAHNPKLRPDTAGVLQHPYFWKVEHKLDFICAVSDNYEERKQKITNIHDENAPRTDAERAILFELVKLQEKAQYVIGVRKSDGTLQDFLQALPKSFLNEMGKQRKYTGTKMIDLLRVIRNKKNHFHDLPADVKEMMIRAGNKGAADGSKSGQIEGYYAFWRDRFPSLLVNCHQLLEERSLIEEFGLERYYDGTVL